MAEGPGADAPPLGRRIWIAWALLLGAMLLGGLGAAPLFDVDEGAFSEATREMLASGDWGHTTLNGEPRFDKPIGVYWLQAASVALLGLNEFALRLPSALATWVLALSAAAFAAPRWGHRAAITAGTVLATSLGMFVIGRAATADGVLNLLLALAALDAWRYGETQNRWALRRAYLWVGLGFLVKGPVAALVPAAALIVWTLTSRQLPVLLRALAHWWGWAIFIAVAAPWYLYALDRHGMAFVEGFLLKHNVQRFSGPMEGHGGTPLYYLMMLPLLAMPWAAAMAAVLSRARTLWHEPLARYLLGWCGFVIVFFSLSGTKLPHYVLYGYVPLALLMGRALAHAGPALMGWSWALLVAWVAGLSTASWLAPDLASGIADPLYRALLQGAPRLPWWPAAMCLAAMGMVALGWRVVRGVEIGRAARLCLAAGLYCSLLAWSLVPWWGEALQGPVRRAAAVAARSGAPAVQWNLHLPSFALYLSRETPRRPPRPGELAFSRVDRLPADAGPRLYEERGLVLLAPHAGP